MKTKFYEVIEGDKKHLVIAVSALGAVIAVQQQVKARELDASEAAKIMASGTIPMIANASNADMRGRTPRNDEWRAKQSANMKARWAAKKDAPPPVAQMDAH